MSGELKWDEIAARAALLSVGPKERQRFCTRHLMGGKQVDATCVCTDPDGLQWYACADAAHQDPAVFIGVALAVGHAIQVTPITEWWAMIDAVIVRADAGGPLDDGPR